MCIDGEEKGREGEKRNLYFSKKASAASYSEPRIRPFSE